MTARSSETEPEVNVEATETPVVDLSATVEQRDPKSAASNSLLDSILASTKERSGTSSSRLELFLGEATPAAALRLWLGTDSVDDRQDLILRLSRDIALIDELLNDQVNALLHHPAFRRLEATWRGLEYLVNRSDAEDQQNVKIKVLNAKWRELERDAERAGEFDQSHLFRKVYEQEFGSAGGEPFGLLIGDYEIHPHLSPDHPYNDIEVLRSISQVAAAAFCPFVTSASPTMFGLDDFGTLEHDLHHARTFEHLDYLKWNALRDSEDSRFVALLMPRVLMRLPYEDDGSRVDRFCFREDVSEPGLGNYLWGSAGFALAGAAIRAFSQSGWLADIRGVQRGVEGGGLITDLPVHCFNTDKDSLAPKSSTDIVITDELEKELSELGFISLCDCADTLYSAFYSVPTVQRPKKHDRTEATLNAKMSSMLQYILCVSRFAHYVKVLARGKVGTFGEASKLERFLNDWVVEYVTSDSEASPEVRARRPLADAKVEVKEQPGRPGNYQCMMHFLPHFELDQVAASVQLTTRLTPSRTD